MINYLFDSPGSIYFIVSGEFEYNKTTQLDFQMYINDQVTSGRLHYNADLPTETNQAITLIVDPGGKKQKYL